MRRAVIVGAASCALMFSAVACGTAAPPPVVAGVAAQPMPAGVAIGRPAALKGSTPLGGTCKPLSGVAPTGALPAPGHMPAGSTMATIQRRGYLRVGVDQTTLFFGYRDASGNLVGFDDDVARQVAQAIFGNPNAIRFTVITSAQRIPDVRDGVVDLIADNMTITCDRLQLVAFSSGYYNAGQTILVPANSRVTSITQLGGQRVCAAGDLYQKENARLDAAYAQATGLPYLAVGTAILIGVAAFWAQRWLAVGAAADPGLVTTQQTGATALARPTRPPPRAPRRRGTAITRGCTTRTATATT